LFYEVQRFPQRRAAVALAIPPCGMLGLLVWQVLLGHSWGKQPLSNANIIGWTVFLWIIYFRLITVRLVTEVRDTELIVTLRGFWHARQILLSDSLTGEGDETGLKKLDVSFVQAIVFADEEDRRRPEILLLIMADQAASNRIAFPHVDRWKLTRVGLSHQNVDARLCKFRPLAKFIESAPGARDRAADPVRDLYDLDAFRSSAGQEHLNRIYTRWHRIISFRR